ncbi:MAG TPA: efflux RND transporter periplasmic adaptor subunit [Nitrospira sp.]|nr:efflux RND transporter periplasmic adaptor subunit [Nitrospira sp.]
MKLPRLSRISLATCFGGVLLIALMPTAGCTHQDEQSQQIVRPVKVARITDQTDSVMSFAGDVRARYETTVSFRVAGKLLTRHIDVGDRVRKGQVLARLDQNDYRLAVQDLQAQLASAIANRDFLRDDVTRYRELLAQNVTSPPEFDRHQTAYTTARERAAALQAQLGHAVNQLAYTELSADRDGVVTALEVEKGQVVSAGQAVLKLAQLDEKEIYFDVPEHRLPELTRRQVVDITLWADQKRRLKGHIREIASAADPATRTYRVKAALLERQDTAQLGMTATVWVPSNMPARITVPLSAVFTPQNKPAQPHVWLVDEPSGTVRSVPIQIGEPLDGEHITVTGLASGQVLVSAGVQRLAEGQVVRWTDTMVSAMHEERQP